MFSLFEKGHLRKNLNLAATERRIVTLCNFDERGGILTTEFRKTQNTGEDMNLFKKSGVQTGKGRGSNGRNGNGRSLGRHATKAFWRYHPICRAEEAYSVMDDMFGRLADFLVCEHSLGLKKICHIYLRRTAQNHRVAERLTLYGFSEDRNYPDRGLAIKLTYEANDDQVFALLTQYAGVGTLHWVR